MWHLSGGNVSRHLATHATTHGVVSLMRAVASGETQSLPRAILGLLEPALQVDHCAVFSFPPSGAPRLECEASALKRPPLPAEVGSIYVQQHYRYDRAPRFMKDLSRRGVKGLFVFNQHLSDIDDASYRATCYERSDVVDRLSVLMPIADERRAQHHWLAINLYRRHGALSFTAPEARNAFELFAVAAAAADVKHRLGVEAPLLPLASAAGGPLSAREHEVACLVADGLSSKQIAARLGICPSTVTTLRKRAYRKLGVPNGKGLGARWRRDTCARPH
jgi:DNA-binding CsgD family transcriptional regulator